MSSFCTVEHKHYIAKARKVRKTTGTYPKTEALAKRMGKAVGVNLHKGITTFKKGLNPDAIATAVRTGSYGEIMATIPWEDLPKHLKHYEDRLEDSYNGAAGIAIEALPAPTKRGLRFDFKNPAISRYVNKRSGELIIGLHKDLQDAVHSAVQKTFTHAFTPRQVADHIKDSVGLDPRREKALRNYANGLAQKGYPPENIQKYSDAYANRLLDQRCMTIGRTETKRAANKGQLSVWKQASNEGLIEKETTRKVWVVDGNPCDICEPMDGISVPIDGFWVLDDGTGIEDPSDSHPNCYCGMELEFVEPGEADDEE